MGSGGAGADLTAPHSSVQGCGPGARIPRAPAACALPRGAAPVPGLLRPRRRSQPRGGGAPRPPPYTGPLFPAAGAGFARSRARPGGKSRGRRLCRRRAPPAFEASCERGGRRPLTSWAGGSSEGCGPKRRTPAARPAPGISGGGPGCWSVGAAAADSVLGPREARAGRAPLGPSRDHGEDGPRRPRGRRTSGRRGGLPGSGPFPARPPGRAPEPGAGTRSGRGRERAVEGPRGTSSGWWRRGLEATLA